MALRQSLPSPAAPLQERSRDPGSRRREKQEQPLGIGDSVLRQILGFTVKSLLVQLWGVPCSIHPAFIFNYQRDNEPWVVAEPRSWRRRTSGFAGSGARGCRPWALMRCGGWPRRSGAVEQRAQHRAGMAREGRPSPERVVRALQEELPQGCGTLAPRIVASRGISILLRSLKRTKKLERPKNFSEI